VTVDVVSVGVATAIVEVPPGPVIVEVVSVFAAWTSSVPVMATAVDDVLGETVPSCCAAAADPVEGGTGSPVPDVPFVLRSVAFPIVVESAG
jgi:hypothetical protein